MIQLDVFDYRDPTQYMGTLHARLNPQNLDEIAGQGGGSFLISRSDPEVLAKPDLLHSRNVMKIKIDGRYVSAFLLLSRKAVMVTADEAAGEYWELGGEGLKTWFDDAIVKPYKGLQQTSSNERSFNFSSERAHWYNDSEWGYVYKIGAVYTIKDWGYQPDKWHGSIPMANWIWGAGYGNNAAPNSTTYFRTEFDMAVATRMKLWAAGDDTLDAWLDGEQIIDGEGKGGAYGQPTKVDFVAQPGHHVLAFKVTNFTGLAGLLAATVQFHPANGVELLHRYSGQGDLWRTQYNPATPPSWTAGEVMLTLLDEAETRGVYFPTWIDPTFTEDYDSNGDPWETVFDWTFKIGESLLSVIQKFEDAGYVVWIDPDSYEFNIGQYRGTDRSGFTLLNGQKKGPVTFQRGRNLLEASTQSLAKIKNNLAVKASDGWALQVDFDSQRSYGVLESQISTDVSRAQASAVASKIFAQRAIEEEGAVYTIFPDEGNTPYVDFNVGDWVLAPNDKGLLVKRRVMSISISELENGQVKYDLEFDTIFQDNEARLSQIVGKTSSGRGPGATMPTVGGNDKTNAPVFSLYSTGTYTIIPKAPVDLAGTSEGHWTPDGMKATSTMTLLWSPVALTTRDDPAFPTAYEVWGKSLSAPDNPFTIFTTVAEPSVIIEDLQPLLGYKWKVRALVNEQQGDFSEEYSFTPAAPANPLATPAAPSLSSDKGLLTVAWNGKLGGTDPLPPFRYAYAEIGTSATGPWQRMGPSFLRDTRTISIPGLMVGQQYFARLTAVDGLGLLSEPSQSGSTTLLGIDLGSLEQDVADAIDAAKDAADQAKETADGANVIAAAAQEAAEEKAQVFYQDTPPPVAGLNNNDVWYDTNQGYKQYFLKNGAWVAAPMGMEALGDDVGQAIDNAASSPITDDRLTEDLSIWPFVNGTIPNGALKPGAVRNSDIADFALTVRKFNTKQHHLY